MEWLKQLIENALKDKVKDGIKVDEIVSGLVEGTKKEMGKHFVPKEEFNSKNEELKTTKTKMDELQTKVETLSNSGEEVSKIKEQLTAATAELVTFKTETEKREANRKKVATIEKGLREAKAAEDAIDLLTSQFDLDKLTLDDKGAIVNWDTHLTSIKETRKSLFGQTTFVGGAPNPNGGTGGNSGTWETKLADARKTGKNLEVIKVKQDAAKEGIFLT